VADGSVWIQMTFEHDFKITTFFEIDYLKKLYTLGKKSIYNTNKKPYLPK